MLPHLAHHYHHHHVQPPAHHSLPSTLPPTKLPTSYQRRSTPCTPALVHPHHLQVTRCSALSTFSQELESQLATAASNFVSSTSLTHSLRCPNPSQVMPWWCGTAADVSELLITSLAEKSESRLLQQVAAQV
ncbi:hypothetical protein K491DRAFT_85993 [Lophiostoma macrostomum CBS 122681]|uniref:Uncharacterized protein n=1 Tax=Lophiostoma macrostomum CBS 122681 TaxID=1314788 RepID=A0A6A6SVL0_9PLEO|nr:hypothetical protein K491DRAFT_85993 [Lophiostoma macrostomum CBS 122681]